MFTTVHLFFTFWVFLLTLFHHHTHKYINLLYLSFITFITGLYLSHVHPGYFKFTLFSEEYVMKGVEKFVIVDLFGHFFVLAFIYSRYSSYYKNWSYQTLTALFMIAVYVLLTKNMNIYHIKTFELFSVFMIASLLYVMFQK